MARHISTIVPLTTRAVAIAISAPVYAAPVKLICRGTTIDASVGRIGTGDLIFVIDDANRSVSAPAAYYGNLPFQIPILQYDENEIRFSQIYSSGWHAQFTINRLMRPVCGWA